jgi:hypothetical protein
VLDGRLIHALEAANGATSRYKQHLHTEVVQIRKDVATGKKHVLAKCMPLDAAGAQPAAAKANNLETLGYDQSGYWSGVTGSHGEGRAHGVDGEGALESLITYVCDVVVLATQPGPALAILAASTSATKEAAAATLECPRIPDVLPNELAKCVPTRRPAHTHSHRRHTVACFLRRVTLLMCTDAPRARCSCALMRDALGARVH